MTPLTPCCVRLGVACLAVWALSSAAVAASVAAGTSVGPYIVRLAEPPAASYTGGLANLPATKPARGQRLSTASANVQAYSRFLDQRQSGVISALGRVSVSQRYTLAFNGFSAKLTAQQVAALRANPAVSAVEPAQLVPLATSYTPSFLGLDKPNGLWTQLGGRGASGEDVIVGIIDSGVMPNNPAFSDKVDANGVPTFSSEGSLAYGPAPARWRGSCQTGPGFTSSDCNNKLIGARFFNSGFNALMQSLVNQLGIADARLSLDSDYLSPLDGNGHGSHTASITAGNANLPAADEGTGLGGRISGMAPRARVAIYKVCWNAYYNGKEQGNSCASPDLLAAVEQAVADQVQVINFSISGGVTVDSVELAFLGASDAGIFVSAAGGNSGPATSLQHQSPWLTTVAASSHDRFFEGQVLLGNGSTFVGLGIAPNGTPQYPVVLASRAISPGVPTLTGSLCGANTLDSAKVSGKIVVCDRGTYPLVDKASAVQAAGGVGMILLNVNGGDDSLVTVPYSIPTVQLPAMSAAAVKAYAAQTGAMAAISPTRTTFGNVPAPIVANFSSRGPNSLDPSIMKPDLAAPGVGILAAYQAATREQHDQAAAGGAKPPATYIFESGTSMAAPHVAGIAALLMQRHPSWSPAAIKSALMTTAYDTRPDNIMSELAGTGPWGQGAGHIDPTRASDPGLVYDVLPGEYQRYLCTLQKTCVGQTTLAPTDLNQPALTVPEMVSSKKITRRVTNVGVAPATYVVTANLPGFNVAVSPTSLTLTPGQTLSYTVTITRTSAVFDTYAIGSLTWSDGVHQVRSPLIARPRMIAGLPTELSKLTSLKDDSRLFGLETDYSGNLTAKGWAFKEEQFTATSAAKQQSNWSTYCNGYKVYGDPNSGLLQPSDFVFWQQFNVPTGTPVLYVSGWPVPGDFPDGTPLADLVGFTPPGAGFGDVTGGVAFSNHPANLPHSGVWITSIPNPQPGLWTVCASSRLVSGPVKTIARIWAHTGSPWTLQVAGPASVFRGSTATLGMSWSGLERNKFQLGAIEFLSGSQRLGLNLLDLSITDFSYNITPLPTITSQPSPSEMDAARRSLNVKTVR